MAPVIAGATSTGGVAAFFVKALRARARTKTRAGVGGGDQQHSNLNVNLRTNTQESQIEPTGGTNGSPDNRYTE
jgi:hypothetical protein